MSNVVELKGVSKVFGDLLAVDNVNLEIKDGEFMTFLGPSGCGKTTTLRLIAGFYACDKGKVYLNNKDVTSVPPNKRDTAMVFQDYALFPHMTVYDNISYGLKLKDFSKAEIDKKVQNALEQVQLSGLDNRGVDQLSGGQQQRVAVARALVMDPVALLMDEPLSNLDAKLREDVRAELRMIQQEVGITTIYVTHDQDEALTMSDRIAVMNKGRIEQLGSAQEIYFNPATRFVADFIGTTNGIEGEVEERSGEKAFKFNKGSYASVHEDIDTGEAFLSIRPEFIKITPDNTSFNQNYDNVYKGEIEQVLFVGEKTRYYVKSEDRRWIIDVFGEKNIYSANTFVNIGFNYDDSNIIYD